MVDDSVQLVFGWALRRENKGVNVTVVTELVPGKKPVLGEPVEGSYFKVVSVVDQFENEYELTAREESAIINEAFSKLLGYEHDLALGDVCTSGMN